MKPTTLTCPLGSECRTETSEGITQCQWYTQLRGTDPQTGEAVDEWGCAMKWLPMLLIESTQQTRQAGAAIESLRNETIKRQNLALSKMKSIECGDA